MTIPTDSIQHAASSTSGTRTVRHRLVNIDNGGTLTDICVMDGDNVIRTKTLTTPHDLSQCLFDGLRKASVAIYGNEDRRRCCCRRPQSATRRPRDERTRRAQGPRLAVVGDAVGRAGARRRRRCQPVRRGDRQPRSHAVRRFTRSRRGSGGRRTRGVRGQPARGGDRRPAPRRTRTAPEAQATAQLSAAPARRATDPVCTRNCRRCERRAPHVDCTVQRVPASGDGALSQRRTEAARRACSRCSCSATTAMQGASRRRSR